MRMDLAVRFDYGEVVPWVTSHDGLTRLTAGPDSVALWHRVETEGKDMRTVADFTVTERQRYPFTLVWYPSHEEPAAPARQLLRGAPHRGLLDASGRRSAATWARTATPWCARSSRSRR